MQIAATAPDIFNLQFQSSSRIKRHGDSSPTRSALEVQEGTSESVNPRLPDPKLDQTIDEVSRITTAFIAALSNGQRVEALLEEIQ